MITIQAEVNGTLVREKDFDGIKPALLALRSAIQDQLPVDKVVTIRILKNGNQKLEVTGTKAHIRKMFERYVDLFKGRGKSFLKVEPEKDITVIAGTLRIQDLMPAFRDKLNEVNTAAFVQVEFSDAPFVPEDAEGDDEHPFWGSMEAAENFHDLVDKLNEVAPKGYYFGSHPGNGSDFGFWQAEEMPGGIPTP